MRWTHYEPTVAQLSFDLGVASVLLFGFFAVLLWLGREVVAAIRAEDVNEEEDDV